jgi:hypothetical protein|tara:strand:- start:322 stop:663 length:342 start_codon:yes stop_codon:yes gene_type:complete
VDKIKKEELDKKWNAIVLKSFKDEDFKQRLVKSPIELMEENGLTIPEGCKAGSGAGKRAGIQLPAEASDEVKEEAKWWNMRLDITREFGKEIIKETGEASGGAPLLDGEGCKA